MVLKVVWQIFINHLAMLMKYNLFKNISWKFSLSNCKIRLCSNPTTFPFFFIVTYADTLVIAKKSSYGVAHHYFHRMLMLQCWTPLITRYDQERLLTYGYDPLRLVALTKSFSLAWLTQGSHTDQDISVIVSSIMIKSSWLTQVSQTDQVCLVNANQICWSPWLIQISQPIVDQFRLVTVTNSG